MKFGKIIIYSIIFLVALSVSRSFVSVNFSDNSINSSVYENLYNTKKSLHSNPRQCGNSNDLSDRHQLRKSFWKVKMKIYDTSKAYFGYTGVAVAFYLLHALAVSITFYFIYQIKIQMLNSLNRTNDNKHSLSSSNIALISVSAIIFLAFFSYVFNGQVGEYSYSIFEALFVSMGLYSALKRNILLFIIVTSLAVLNRESGFLLIVIWLIINGIDFNKFYRNIYLVVPVLVFFVMNADIVHCLANDGFLVSSGPLPGQLTFHVFFEGSWGVIRGAVALMFNYGLFIVPMLLAYRFFTSLLSLSDHVIFNKMFAIVGIYIIVFLVATPLNHMSVKFVISPLFVPLFSLYILGIIQQNNIRLFDIK